MTNQIGLCFDAPDPPTPATTAAPIAGATPPVRRTRGARPSRTSTPSRPQIPGCAVLSPCGLFRYNLRRPLRPASDRRPWMGVLLCNPSTADANEDDPTVAKCIAFAEQWGFGGLRIDNVCALRSTDPKGLLAAADPVGPGNDAALDDWLSDHMIGLRMVGWGALIQRLAPVRKRKPWTPIEQRLRDQLEHVRARLHAYLATPAGQENPLYCWGVNQDGSPIHPLYLSIATPRVLWTPPTTP